MDTLLRIRMRDNFESMYMHILEKLKQIVPLQLLQNFPF
jgi:hypothetical protein